MIRGCGRKTRRSIACCRYTDEVTDLLARRIRKMPEYSDCKVESMGPFGLGAECSVSVKRGEDLIGFLTVVYGPNQEDRQFFEYVDYKAPKNNTYPNGSIGDINGFNQQTRPMSSDINEVLALIFDMSE